MRQKWIWISAVSLATALVTAACGSSGGAKPSASGLEKTHLTVAALPIVDDAPLFLAIKKGFFRQAGLTVTPKIITQSTLAVRRDAAAGGHRPGAGLRPAAAADG
jgi:NitT/TauT family transport system substrate-binding protein